MACSIGRKVLIRYVTCDNSWSNICPLSVRRNASSILPGDEPLSPEASTTSMLGLSKQEAVRQKKTAAATFLLSDYGFTDAQISKLESRSPYIFKYSPEKNLSLKLKFLESIGLSRTDIPKLVPVNPYLLSSSLEKKMIPSYNYLKNLNVSEEQLHLLLMSRPRMITLNLEATIAPNVELLRGIGVPLSIITYCVTTHLTALFCKHALFKSLVDQAIKIELNPLKKAFIIAVHVLYGNSKETWARKMEIFRGFGLSDDEILLAFRKQPWIMALSEKKIARGLEFFLKEMNWTSATLVSNPVVLKLNLERRVVPRCQVVEILKKKGLLNIAHVNFLMISEEKFLSGYIYKYKDESSELMDVYKRYKSSTSQKKIL